MAKYGSDDVGFLLIDGYDVLGVQTRLEDKVKAITEETTPLGGTWGQHESIGLKSYEIIQQGFYDTGTNLANEALNEKQGEERPIAFGFEGNTTGQDFVGFVGVLQTGYVRMANVGELHKANAEYEGSGIREEGKIIGTHATRTTVGDTESTSVDNTSSSTDGFGYLQVSALTLGGYTNLTVKLRDSADDITFADLDTFTVVTAAPTAERNTITGTIERYVACSWAWTGSGSGQTTKFMVGLIRS